MLFPFLCPKQKSKLLFIALLALCKRRHSLLPLFEKEWRGQITQMLFTKRETRAICTLKRANCTFALMLWKMSDSHEKPKSEFPTLVLRQREAHTCLFIEAWFYIRKIVELSLQQFVIIATSDQAKDKATTVSATLPLSLPFRWIVVCPWGYRNQIWYFWNLWRRRKLPRSALNSLLHCFKLLFLFPLRRKGGIKGGGGLCEGWGRGFGVPPPCVCIVYT